MSIKGHYQTNRMLYRERSAPVGWGPWFSSFIASEKRWRRHRPSYLEASRPVSVRADVSVRQTERLFISNHLPTIHPKHLPLRPSAVSNTPIAVVHYVHRSSTELTVATVQSNL